MSAARMFVNKCIASNHEQKFPENHVIRIHETLRNVCIRCILVTAHVRGLAKSVIWRQLRNFCGSQGYTKKNVAPGTFV